MRCSRVILLTTVCVGVLLLPGIAWGEDVRTITVKASEAFEQGMGAWGVRAAGDGSAVVLHDRMLAIYYGDKPLSRSNFKGNLTAVSDQVGTCWDTETAPGNIDSRSIAKKRPPRWVKWGILRMMSRNNFYSQIRPLPKTQGFTWDYSDYWIWEDARTPPHYAYRYRNITGRRSDWQWTPNRVRFDTTCSADSRALTVRMSTVTPGFKTFVVRTDGGPWRPSGRDLTWTLHDGRNKLEMRTRNVMGVEGAVSSIELDLAR